MALVKMKTCGAFGVLLSMLMLLSGCDKSEVDSLDVESKVTLPGSDQVLVRINNEVITQYDFQLAIDSLLGAEQGALLDQNGRKEMLESMVASRAIAIKAEQEITALQVEELNKKVQAFREQLLVKEYLKANTTPQPVTKEMVEDFYNNNPDRFGAKSVRKYELLAHENNATAAPSRSAIYQTLSTLAKDKNWASYGKGSQRGASTIYYQSGEVDRTLLNRKLLRLLDSLDVGETSDVTYINGTAHIARIISEQHQAPRPIDEVSAEIRKMLAPQQLKKAITEATDKVLSEFQVVYLDSEKQ